MFLDVNYTSKRIVFDKSNDTLTPLGSM